MVPTGMPASTLPEEGPLGLLPAVLSLRALVTCPQGRTAAIQGVKDADVLSCLRELLRHGWLVPEASGSPSFRPLKVLGLLRSRSFQPLVTKQAVTGREVTSVGWAVSRSVVVHKGRNSSPFPQSQAFASRPLAHPLLPRQASPAFLCKQ